MENYPIAIANCCQEWPVFLAMPIGRCGICNERPTVDLDTVEIVTKPLDPPAQLG